MLCLGLLAFAAMPVPQPNKLIASLHVNNQKLSQYDPIIAKISLVNQTSRSHKVRPLGGRYSSVWLEYKTGSNDYRPMYSIGYGDLDRQRVDYIVSSKSESNTYEIFFSDNETSITHRSGSFILRAVVAIDSINLIRSNSVELSVVARSVNHSVIIQRNLTAARKLFVTESESDDKQIKNVTSAIAGVSASEIHIYSDYIRRLSLLNRSANNQWNSNLSDISASALNLGVVLAERFVIDSAVIALHRNQIDDAKKLYKMYKNNCYDLDNTFSAYGIIK